MSPSQREVDEIFDRARQRVLERHRLLVPPLWPIIVLAVIGYASWLLGMWLLFRMGLRS